MPDVLRRIGKYRLFIPWWKPATILSMILLVVGFFMMINFNLKNNGLTETLAFMNSLDGADGRVAWSNKKSFCDSFIGKCFWGEEIAPNTDIDYAVFFINQMDRSDINNGRFSDLMGFPESLKVIHKKNFFLRPEKSRILEAKNVPQDLLPTAPEFTFTLLGDSQVWPKEWKGTGAFPSILKKAEELEPDLVLSVGDLAVTNACRVAEKCAPYFENWKVAVEKINPRIYPAVGNHDFENGAMDLWKKIFNTPENGPPELKGTVFSFDYSNSHFVFLNSELKNGDLEDSPQFKWLKIDLEKNKKKNVFVISHRPDFPGKSFVQRHKWRTLLEGNTLAYFSGHIHTYCYRQVVPESVDSDSEKPLHHFIIGNSEAKPGNIQANCQQASTLFHFGMARVKGSELTLKIYASDGNVVFENKIKNESYYE